MSVAITVENLSSTIRVGFFNRPLDILHDVSFSVPVGQVVGFVGENGAGKSTTIKTIIGALRPSKGVVRVMGDDPSTKAGRARFGYLPEFPRLPQTLTPVEILRLHGQLAGLSADETKRRTADLLDQVSLSHRADNRISTFSKGMQQRIALAIALISAPEVLILDEPMSGLDPRGRRLVRDLITDQKARGKTVFFSSHVLPDVEALCDQVVVMHQGRLVAMGTLESIFSTTDDAAEIRFSTDAADVVELARGGGEVTRRGDTWVLRTGDDDPFAVAQRLAGAGARIVAVSPHAQELADALVHLTEVDNTSSTREAS